MSSRSHGGLLDAELSALGLDARDVVDFSVNVNAYGPCPAVVEAVRAAPVDRYPDPTAFGARRSVARSIDVDPARIVLAPGTADLLWTIARVLLTPGDLVWIVEPAFAEMAAAARSAGARVEPARLESLGEVRPKLVYLAAPANPTGAAVPASDVAAVARSHPQVAFVVDQAFLSLSDRHADARVAMPDNTVVLRSLTKDHALAGLRVGYAVASRDVAARIEASRPPWSTSGPAQAAAVAAIESSEFVPQCRARLFADRDALARDIAALGLRVRPTSTVFFLVEVGDAARVRRDMLARHRVLVRDCASFGLPQCIRVCARPARDAARLVAALRQETRT